MYWPTGIAKQVFTSRSNRIQVKDNVANYTAGSNEEEPVVFTGSENIIQFAKSIPGSFFATISDDSVRLWSVKPVVELSRIDRSTKHIQQYGKNEQIIWKPDSSCIVIITSKSYLLLYSIITYDNAPALLYTFNTPHAYLDGPGEASGVRTALLKFRLTIRVDAGVACGSSTSEYIVIGTKDPPAIQCIPWHPNEVNQTKTTLLRSLDWWLGAPNDHLRVLYHEKTMNAWIWLGTDGRAYLVREVSDKKERASQSRRGSISASGESSPHRQRRKSSTSLSTAAMWTGLCFHGIRHQAGDNRIDGPAQTDSPDTVRPSVDPNTSNNFQPATCVAMNARFSIISIGTNNGQIFQYAAQTWTSTPVLTEILNLQQQRHLTAKSTLMGLQPVGCLSWTSDGYALVAGWQRVGFALWSVYGNPLVGVAVESDWTTREWTPPNGDSSASEDTAKMSDNSADAYVNGVRDMFWAPACHELFLLAANDAGSSAPEVQIYVLSFAKSGIVSLHIPENVRRCFLQYDDRILIYHGAGQNVAFESKPDALEWTHVQFPNLYIAEHWPVRYIAISSDAKYVAVAGRRGLMHYSVPSGRWKVFGNQQQEQEFSVRGGLVWYKNILFAACEKTETGEQEIRAYSRDTNLDNVYMLCASRLHDADAVVIYMCVLGKYLLVYTTGNTVTIYRIKTGDKSKGVALIPLMHISLQRIVTQPARVRALWFLPEDSELDSIEQDSDFKLAHLLLLIDGKLVLVRNHEANPIPTDDSAPALIKAAPNFEVIANGVEYFWVGSPGPEMLRKSLWIFNGLTMKMVLKSNQDTYTASHPKSSEEGTISPARFRDEEGQRRILLADPKPSVHARHVDVPMDSYPLMVSLEKGLVTGIEQTLSFQRSGNFLIFKPSAKSHLFIHHVIKHLLENNAFAEALLLGRSYEHLDYFGHSLEILLHTVLEDEANSNDQDEDEQLLPQVVNYIDRFPQYLDVIVGCARKTEYALWDHLFRIVGDPSKLFELCLRENRLKTASSYLIITHTLNPKSHEDQNTVLLLVKAITCKDFELCEEIVRFLSSIDGTGKALRDVVAAAKNIS